MARHREYATIDVNLFRHPKVIALLAEPAGAEALTDWLRLILWARDILTVDKLGSAGSFSPSMALAATGPHGRRSIRLLIEHGLLDETLDHDVTLHDYAEHQHLAEWAARHHRNVKAGHARAAQAARERAAELIERARIAQGRSRFLGDQAEATRETAQSLAEQPRGQPRGQPRLQPRDQPVDQPRLNASSALSHLNSVSPNGDTNDRAAGSRPDHGPEPGFDEFFDEFWDAYPRHVAKPKAREAWPKAVVAAKGPVPLVEGARRYAKQCEQNRTEQQYIAHPTSWLNAGRWADEYGSDDPSAREVAPEWLSSCPLTSTRNGT